MRKDMIEAYDTTPTMGGLAGISDSEYSAAHSLAQFVDSIANQYEHEQKTKTQKTEHPSLFRGVRNFFYDLGVEMQRQRGH